MPRWDELWHSSQSMRSTISLRLSSVRSAQPAATNSGRRARDGQLPGPAADIDSDAGPHFSEAGSDSIAVIPREWLRDADHRLHDRGASRAPDLTRLGEATDRCASRRLASHRCGRCRMPGRTRLTPGPAGAGITSSINASRGRDSLTRIRSRFIGDRSCDGSRERPRRPPRSAMAVPGVRILARFSGSVGTQLPNDDCCQGQHCPDKWRTCVGPPILLRIHGARLALGPLHEAVDVGYPGPDDDLVAGLCRSAADASAGQLLRGL